MVAVDLFRPVRAEHQARPEHELEQEGGHHLDALPPPDLDLRHRPNRGGDRACREGDHRRAQPPDDDDVPLDSLVHGLHVSFDERVHGRAEDLGEQEQALAVGVGLAVLPRADRLSAHVHARREVDWLH